MLIFFFCRKNLLMLVLMLMIAWTMRVLQQVLLLILWRMEYFIVMLDPCYLSNLPHLIWNIILQLTNNLVFIISVSLNGCGLDGAHTSDMVPFNVRGIYAFFVYYSMLPCLLDSFFETCLVLLFFKVSFQAVHRIKYFFAKMPPFILHRKY